MNQTIENLTDNNIIRLVASSKEYVTQRDNLAKEMFDE